MSDVSDKSKSSIIVSDYSAIAPGTNKLNILGAFTTVFLGTKLNQGSLGNMPVPDELLNQVMTPAFGVVVSTSFDPGLVGQDYVFSLDLRNEVDDVISVPGTPDGGKLRITQALKVEKPSLPGLTLRSEKIWPRNNSALTFPTGIILTPECAYRWVLQIDGNEMADFPFYVSGGNPAVLFG